jgi:hypothetical protein
MCARLHDAEGGHFVDCAMSEHLWAVFFTECARPSLKLSKVPANEPPPEKYIWVPFLDPEVIKILASFIHTYVGSFFFDPVDNRKLSLGAIWNFGRNRAPLI